MVSRVENQLLLHQVIEDLKRGLTGHFKEKKCKGHVTKEKIPPPFTFKKEQTNKQEQKQNKTNPWSRFLISVINSGSASFSIVVFKLPLIFNNVLIFRADVLIFRCFFNTVHS